MDILRQQLVKSLDGKEAHADFEKVFGGVPVEARGLRAPGAPHTLWQLLEHLRIAQWDILEFSRNAKHVSPPWPEGYWPATEGPPDGAAWDHSIEAFQKDLKSMRKLVSDANTDLLAKIPHGDGQTILREALLVADHNSYHMGQAVLLRQLLGVW